nr:hypothetical protein [uncultured Jannaschia sp.]
MGIVAETLARLPPRSALPRRIDFARHGLAADREPRFRIPVERVEQYQLVVAGQEDDAIGADQPGCVHYQPDGPQAVQTAVDDIAQEDDEAFGCRRLRGPRDPVEAGREQVGLPVDVTAREDLEIGGYVARQDARRQRDVTQVGSHRAWPSR